MDDAQELENAVNDIEKTEVLRDESFLGSVDVCDHWDSIKYNPLGRRDFAPPEGHEKITIEKNLASVVSLYGADLKRLFKGYTNVEGHKSHARFTSGTFDDRRKSQNRIEIPALISLLRDFRLIAKQNQARTKFLHKTDIQWIKRGLLPCITPMGNFPISIEEVKRIVQKWRRRPLRNGEKEVQYVLEDIDIGGFVQILSRVSLLGFRRLQALQRNLDREAWSSAARRSFRLLVPPPLRRNRGKKFGEDRIMWSLGSASSRSFRRLDPLSRTWQSTQQRRQASRSESESEMKGGTHTAQSHDLIVCKVARAYTPREEYELLIDTVATSIDPYRDTDAMSRVSADRRAQYRVLFDMVDTDQSGTIERKELLYAIHRENVSASLVETSPALAPLLDVDRFNEAYDEIDTDHDGALTFSEFVAFLEAFEDDSRKALHGEVHRVRYQRRLSRARKVADVFQVLNRLGRHPGAGRLEREQLLEAMEDVNIVRQMLAASDAFAVLCDPDTFDEALGMMGKTAFTGGGTAGSGGSRGSAKGELRGLDENDLIRFCDAYDAVLENMDVALGEQTGHGAAKECFKRRIQKIANARTAFELCRPTELEVQRMGKRTGEVVRGLDRSSLLTIVSSRMHKKRIVDAAPALNTLFKPRHFGWSFRLISVLSFGDDESNPDIVTWDGFRDFCLSYEHRLAKQPRLPLKYENDLLRIEHLLVDGIWLRPSRYNGSLILPRYPKTIMCRGELISLDGKLCAEPHPRGIFPLRSVDIVHLERLAFDQDIAASLIQAMVRGVLKRMKMDEEYDYIVMVQAAARGYGVRKRVERGHRERARTAKDEVDRVIQECPPWAVLESVLIRMGMCFSKRSTMHKKLMARNKGFTFAQGENPVRHHSKFNHVGHVHYAPK